MSTKKKSPLIPDELDLMLAEEEVVDEKQKHKLRVASIMNNLYLREAEKYVASKAPKKTKEKRPKGVLEKDIENQIMKFARLSGWHLIKTDATAHFSKAAGRYISSKIKSGTLDLSGSDPEGRAVFIEVKRPDKLSNLSDGQYRTLVNHIERGSFACVVDSFEMLKDIHEEWNGLSDREQKREYLLTLISKKPRRSTRLAV